MNLNTLENVALGNGGAGQAREGEVGEERVLFEQVAAIRPSTCPEWPHTTAKKATISTLKHPGQPIETIKMSIWKEQRVHLSSWLASISSDRCRNGFAVAELQGSNIWRRWKGNAAPLNPEIIGQMETVI
jgi:hypothetical protein